MHGGEGLTIGQVAERLGIGVHALRFYEREGLLIRAPMRVGGRRVFLEEDVEWLEVCLVLRAAGMPVRAVRAYADLVRAGDGNEGERVDLLRRQRRRLGADIAEAERCLSVVDRKLACYEAMARAADARA